MADERRLDDTRLRKSPWHSRSNRCRVELDRHQLLVRADKEQLSTIATPPRLSAAGARDDQARRTRREAFDDDLSLRWIAIVRTCIVSCDSRASSTGRLTLGNEQFNLGGNGWRLAEFD
jgi:hypothetical protein